MRNHRTEHGFLAISLAGIIVFIFVAMTLLTVTLARTAFVARQSHLVLLRKQAEWLAEGAVERGLASLSNAADPSKVADQRFTIRLAPVFVGSDPLSENEGDEPGWDRSITASYEFSIRPTDNFPTFGERPREAKATLLVVGRAKIPYRNTTLTRSSTRLCVLNENGSWTVIPIAHPVAQ